ncbi:hypothetical protein HNQ91_004128 [Filimonas zeae]|uniref:Uncharacterized protein n=1 Tax=Filimonas zeae TaxID=1737353 RepID=A0A917MXY1_9BACT|nr:hypothetical protein [Filimonas zeae]MDR6341055.1 hypothetical protein [Filimonas zeae]GGH77408.1 hypothetical protein GCM10011379_43710 [Filimonas zeae]
MKAQYLIALATLASLSLSCVRRAYYVSPVYGSNTPYHTVPLKKEQIASALYGNASLQTGSANDQGRDMSSNMQINAYRTHNFGTLQAYYGGGFVAGIYNVKAFDTASYRRNTYDIAVAPINAGAGNLFYGTGNIHGGMHVAIPLSPSNTAPELRLGSKVAMHKEFGNYLSFRNSLHSDSVSGLANSSTLGSLSGYTEILFPSSHNIIGAQLEVNLMLGKQYSDIYFGKGTPGGRYAYVNGTLHLTQGKTTAYLQWSLGTRLFGIHLGVNYQLTGKSKKPR